MFFSVLRDEEYEEEYYDDNEGNTIWNNLLCVKFWFLYFECFLDTTVPATINRNGQAEVFNNGKYYNNWRLETVFFELKCDRFIGRQTQHSESVVGKCPEFRYLQFEKYFKFYFLIYSTIYMWAWWKTLSKLRKIQ